MKLFLSIFLIIFFAAKAHSSPYSFAGYTWDQDNTVDRVEFLGEEKTLGGAYFSPGLPSKVTRGVQFPSSPKGFDPSLAIGSKDEQLDAPRALNLPLHDDGMVARHGVAVSWSNNRAIPNLNGEDFAVFESGEDETGKAESRGPELFMVRVRNGISGAWSPWIHQATGRFQHYKLRGRAGAFATGFELDDFGIRFGGLVDRIEIANMTGSDRIIGEKAPFKGRVVFDAVEGSAIPKPIVSYLNSYEENHLYGPDILYVAILQKTITNPIQRDKGAYIPPKLEDPEVEQEVRILAQKGRVDVFENGASAYTSVHELGMGYSIPAGYSVVTSPDSAVTLQIPGGAILILQPSSLLSIDRSDGRLGGPGSISLPGTPGVGESGLPLSSSIGAPPAISINLIRGSFILVNQSNEGSTLPVSVFVGKSALEAPGGGILYFQFGQPLQGSDFHDPWEIRKRFFNLKTSMVSPEPVVEEEAVVLDPPLPEPGPEPTPGPDPEPEPTPKVIRVDPPAPNPTGFPFEFSPHQLAFQGLGFLQNPVIPEGTEDYYTAVTGAPLDPNLLRGLLVPGFDQGPGGNSLAELAGYVDLDGKIMLGADLQDAFLSDSILRDILAQGTSDSVPRLTFIDAEGGAFIVAGGQATSIPPSIQKLLQENPSLVEFIKVSKDGVMLVQNEDGSLDFLLGEDGISILSMSKDDIPLQVSQDEFGNIAFLGQDGSGFGDVLSPGVVGNPGADDEKVIKTPEGREGQLRRAHAQAVAQIAASKQKQRNALYLKQQIAAQQAKTTQKLAQQRAARVAAEKAKAATLRKQQASR
jgi:hypothetical protein